MEEMSIIEQESKKKHRKRANLPSDMTKQHPPPVDSITMNKNPENKTSFKLDQNTDPTYRDCCLHCGNIAYLCHDTRYSKYCFKACCSYLQNNDSGF